MTRKKPAIQIREACKKFGLYRGPVQQALGYFGVGVNNVPHKVAVDRVSLSIEQGEKVGLIGHNGSGKTTLLRLISGFTRPSSGKIEVEGKVQALMQSGYGFNDNLSGLENIRNALVYNGIHRSMLSAVESDIVDFVELGEFLHHPVKTYSLGMRARLEFAAATAIQPEVLIIDEVLGAGDGYFAQKCARRMRNLVSNTTLLLVSHSLDQIQDYCDRLIWMDDGKLKEDGPVDKVIGNYRRYMNERSAQRARIDGSTQSQSIGSTLERLATRPEIPRGTLALSEGIGRVNAFAFDPTGSQVQAQEVGDPLALRLDITLQKPMRLVIVGLTAGGALVFEMATGDVLKPGNHTLTMWSSQLEVGVGNYVLIPALVDPDEDGNRFLGAIRLELKLAVTNWSDPPLVHFDAEWFSGANPKPIASKVNAWV